MSQSVDDTFSVKKMKKDLSVFKEIRKKANSGLYKYRSPQQIDSIYNWAETEIDQSSTFLDFYNIICELTHFEGSLHNDTELPSKYREALRKETSGYFPYPIKWIDGKWRLNYEGASIPLGAEILSINRIPISEIISSLHKYYPTDGENQTGKRIGIRTHFSKYFRLNYGLQKEFNVKYKSTTTDSIQYINLESVGYKDYYTHFNTRHSRKFDQIYYASLNENQKYRYRQIDSTTAILSLLTFSMGNETTNEHKRYVAFLDSVFLDIKNKKLNNLIVDVRVNGGGTDPNDVVTYSYLTDRKFQENKSAWISFRKIPLIQHIDFWLPKFLRPLFVGKYNKAFQKRFPLAKNGRFYQDERTPDFKVRKPNLNAFNGNIYLLISPATASAGSLFAAMLAGNKNSISIGTESMGGYYGHNGHTSLTYKLPKSNLKTTFSVVNLEQDVPQQANQFYNRGIIPDILISQSLKDFLEHKDTVMKFTLNLINESE